MVNCDPYWCMYRMYSELFEQYILYSLSVLLTLHHSTYISVVKTT
jgi:hypothetical protein